MYWNYRLLYLKGYECNYLFFLEIKKFIFFLVGLIKYSDLAIGCFYVKDKFIGGSIHLVWNKSNWGFSLLSYSLPQWTTFHRALLNIGIDGICLCYVWIWQNKKVLYK